MKFKKFNICTKIFIFSFVLLNAFLLFSIVYKERNINNYFRIHVVANSNSVKDQMLKLNVSKDISKYIDTLYNNDKFKSKDLTKQMIEDNLKNILELVNNSIINNGYNYSSSINIGKIYYDKKTNEQTEMSEGVYDSIRIIIGEGQGQNWWSLIYPYSYDTIFIPEEIIEDEDLTYSEYVLSQENIEYSSIILEVLKKIFK